MRTGEEYILTFPVFIVLQAPGQPLGDSCTMAASRTALFSDEPAAGEWLRPGDYLQSFAEQTKLLAHLYGVTDHSHVVLTTNGT